MTPEGPFLKFEGIITQEPVETMVIEGFKHHEKFPKCCAYHIKMDEHITDWWNKFPNCCDTHRYFSKKENFSKSDYQYVIKKILDSIAFIEFHVSQVIDDDDCVSSPFLVQFKSIIFY